MVIKLFRKKGKRVLKTAICLFLSLVLFSSNVFACTAVYVGKDVSTDGSTMIARSEDQGNGAYNKMFVVVPRVEDVPGRFMEDVNGCKLALPETTYKYTMVPDNSEAGDGTYPGACLNEYGLAVTATVTTYANDKALKADPEVEDGIREALLAGAIAATCKDAKEGVKRIGEYMEEYGSAEHNIVMIADQNEAWFVEIYTGHQWAAVKMPKDKVSVFGNEMMLGTIDINDTENYMFSKDIVKLATDNGFAVMENGLINLAKSYSADKEDWAHMRTWIGRCMLTPSKKDTYNIKEFYPLFFEPDKKVSPTDVMNIFRNRYEDTPYDKKLPENRELYAIGNEMQSQIHILQTKDNLPKDISAIQWVALGNTEHTVFLPSFCNINDTIDPYKVDNWDYNSEGAYWKFKRLCAMAEQDRVRFGKGVQETWQLAEELMYEQMQKEEAKLVDIYKNSPDKASEYATILANKMAEDALLMADVMFDELFVYIIDQTGMLEWDRIPDYEGAMILKSFAEYKGYKVGWNAENGTVELEKDITKYILTPGADEYTLIKDGISSVEKLRKEVKIVEGRTFVPLSFIKQLQ